MHKNKKQSDTIRDRRPSPSMKLLLFSKGQWFFRCVHFLLQLQTELLVGIFMMEKEALIMAA